MNRKIVLLLIFFLTAAPVYSQAEKTDKSEQVINLKTDLVVLDVQVVNRQTGQIVTGLTKEDFTLFDEGVNQEISHFSQEKLPLSIVLLLDAKESLLPFIRQIRNGPLQILRRLQPQDEVSIMAFGSSTEILQDFTKDKQLATKKLDEINYVGEKFNA